MTHNLSHPLVSVVVIAIMAVLAGPEAIAEWAELQQGWLPTVLSRPPDTQSKNYLRDVSAETSEVSKTSEVCRAQLIRRAAGIVVPRIEA